MIFDPGKAQRHNIPTQEQTLAQDISGAGRIKSFQLSLSIGYPYMTKIGQSSASICEKLLLARQRVLSHRPVVYPCGHEISGDKREFESQPMCVNLAASYSSSRYVYKRQWHSCALRL